MNSPVPGSRSLGSIQKAGAGRAGSGEKNWRERGKRSPIFFYHADPAGAWNRLVMNKLELEPLLETIELHKLRQYVADFVCVVLFRAKRL